MKVNINNQEGNRQVFFAFTEEEAKVFQSLLIKDPDDMDTAEEAMVAEMYSMLKLVLKLFIDKIDPVTLAVNSPFPKPSMN